MAIKICPKCGVAQNSATVECKCGHIFESSGRRCSKCGAWSPRQKVTCKCGQQLKGSKSEKVGTTITQKIFITKKQDYHIFLDRRAIADYLKALGYKVDESRANYYVSTPSGEYPLNGETKINVTWEEFEHKELTCDKN